MKEQVITARSARRTSPPKGRSATFMQRPARRDKGGPTRANSGLPRRIFAYLPLFAKITLVIATAVLVFVGYRTASSASVFQVRRVDVAGTSRTSADEITTLVRRAAGKAGVWRADLPAISAELERLPGVKTAVVSRVLPDGLRVRIDERVPVGVVRTSAGHFVWTDADAVVLGEMLPTDHIPSFFVRGWNEDATEEARVENVERIQKYMELAREWDASGLSERVSEVNLIDVRDIRAQLAGADSQIELRLGGQDPGKRLREALKVLDGYRQVPQGSLITYVDLTQGNRAIVGYGTGAQISAVGDSTGNEDGGLPPAARIGEAGRQVQTAAGASGVISSRERSKVKPNGRKSETGRAGDKSKSHDEAKALTRSRRTG
ncbi:MAG: FtsQ-type POTRA domain-containing protein [Pyrinomonadaceae bacterium]